MPLEEVKKNNRVFHRFSSFLHFLGSTKIRSKGNGRQVIKMNFCRKKLEAASENYFVPSKLSSVFLMIQSCDKNSFKVQH